MTKFRDYTPEEIKQMEEMRAFYEANQENLESPEAVKKMNSTDFIGTVTSTADIINSENSLEDFRQQEQALEDTKSHLKGMMQNLGAGRGTEKEKPEEPKPDPELEAAMNEANRKVEEENKGELAKLYYTFLEPEMLEKKKAIEEEIANIRESENSYELLEYMQRDGEGGYYPTTKRSMKAEAVQRINELNEQHDFITKPVNQTFRDMTQEKLNQMRELQKSDELPYFSHEYSKTHLAEVFYEKALDLTNANLDKSGMWKALADGVTDEDFWTFGSANIESNIRLVNIAKKIDADQELTEGDIRLLDAYNTYNEAQQNMRVGSGYTIGSSTAATLPWMAQFAATRGVGTSVEKGVEMALKKGVKKYLNKNLKNRAATMLTNAATKFVATSAGVYTQAALMPQTYGDIAGRYGGELQVTRDAEGQIDGYYMRDKLQQKVTLEQEQNIAEIKADPNSYDENGNLTEKAQAEIDESNDIISKAAPSSLLGATYKGMTNSAIEALTERVGGEFIVNRLKKLGVPGGLLPKNKYTDKVETFKKAVGWNGIAPEYIEEVMNIPMNAMFVGDSEYSDLWDGQQQLETLAMVALTGGLMNVSQQGIGQLGRLSDKEYYKERKKMINRFKEMGRANPNSLDDFMFLASTSGDILKLKEMERDLREKGNTKEADAISEKIVYNQMLKAFDTHTNKEFENALDQVAMNPETSEGVKQNIARAKADMRILERTKERFGHLPNSSTLMRLTANKLLGRRAEQEIDMQIADLEQEVTEDINALAKSKRYKIPEFGVSDLFDREFEDKKENDDYQKFLDRVRKGKLLSVSQLENLQTAKKVINDITSEQRLIFNEQVSPEFQQKLKDEMRLKDKINRNRNISKAVEENDDEAFNKEFDMLSKKFKGSLSQKRIDEIKQTLLERIGLVKALEEVAKQEKIQQKVQEAKKTKDDEVIPESKPEVVKEEAIEDERTDEINKALNEEFSRETEMLKEDFNQPVQPKAKDIPSDRVFAQSNNSRLLPNQGEEQKPLLVYDEQGNEHTYMRKEFNGANGLEFEHYYDGKQVERRDIPELYFTKTTEAVALQAKHSKEIREHNNFASSQPSFIKDENGKTVENKKHNQEAVRRKKEMEERHKAEREALGKSSSKATVIKPNDPGFFSADLPRSLNTDMSEEQKARIRDRVKSMYDILKSQLDKTPTFKDFINKFIDSTSPGQAEEFYNVLASGWEMNGYAKTDYQKAYNEIFDPFKEIANELAQDDSVLGPESKTELDIIVDKELKKAEEEQAPIIDFTPENVPVKKAEGMKTVTSELKLGFLSIKYEEEFDENGIMQTKSVSSTLNLDGILDFRDLLDPDKYNTGSELHVAVPPAEVLDEIYITKRKEDGTKYSIKFNEWLDGKLKENPDFMGTLEYASTVPMIAYSRQGKPLAYIHDLDWYNPYNVGYSDNPPLQAEIIENAKENALRLRQGVLSGRVNKIRVKEKSGETFHKIPKEQPTKSISEANPQSVIAVSKNRGQVSIGVNSFETPNRVVVNKDSIEKGHTYDLRRMGTDSQGRETWRAFPVLRGDEKNDYKLSDKIMETVKWAFGAYLKLQTDSRGNELTSYWKDKPFQMTKEKAQEVVDRILEQTGYDISTREDARNFLRLFVYIKDFDYKTLADKLFSNDPELAKDFQQHTSNEGLGINPKMVSISTDGTVNPSEKTYQDFLKDNLRTNVQSFNVGTEENPVYATAIQPSITFEYEGQEIQEETPTKKRIEEAAKEVSQEITQEDSASEIERRAKETLRKLGFGGVSFDLPTQINDDTKIRGIFNTTPGLTVLQEYQLIDFIFNKVSTALDIKKGSTIKKEDIMAEIYDAYNEIVAPSRQEVQKVLKDIKTLYESNPEKYSNLSPLIQEYTTVLETYQNIKDNWKDIEKKAMDKLFKYTGITETEDKEDENMSLREKDYSKSSLEENGKNKTSYRLRRFFAGIEKKTPQGQTKKGFLNLPTYIGFNDVYNTIAQILTSPVEIESSFELMMAKLRQAKDTHPWIIDVVNRLNNADEQIKKEFVYNYTKHTLSMKFAMYSEDGTGKYSLKVYDTNANEITRLIRNTWRSNFIAGPLVNSSQELYSVNKVHAQNLLDQFESWGNEKSKVNTDTVREWLANFGIVMSKDAFNELVERGMYYNGEYIDYSDMFDSNDTVFGLLHTYLKYIVKQDNTEFEENENNHPFTDMQGVLQTLSMIESKYTNQSMTLSFRDNGKSIFGLTPNKFATDRVLALKQYGPDGNNPFVQDLLELSMSSESMLLQLLQLEESFRGKLGIDHMGITALKQLGKKASPFSSITDLSSVDHDLAKFTGFQDTKQGTVTAKFNDEGKIVQQGNGISMRIGRMFLPTMSDKSQMLMLSTAVLNLMKDKSKAFNINSDGTITFKEPLKKILFNQIVLPELKRIIKFHKNINKTNIKDYDLAAQIFNFIPELNNIKDKEGLRMIELIANAPDVYSVEKVIQEFGSDIDDVVYNVVMEGVNKKFDIWESAVERDDEGKVEKVKFFDNSYLSQTSGTMEEKYRVAMFDFIINSMISNANMFSVIAGDPAMYSQDKNFKNFGVDNISITALAEVYGKEGLFQKPFATYQGFKSKLDSLYKSGQITEKLYDEMSDKIKPSPFSVFDDEAYIELSKANGTNLGKRLALLIAPGNKIAESKQQKYMQIFLKDSIDMAENIEYLISLYYGKDTLKEVQPDIDRYKQSTNKTERAEIRDSLGKKFRSIADYFDIESTDAQEYTTLWEHITVLNGQGRLSDSQLNQIKEKISKEEDLTKEELDLVLQPIKPVYTGQIVDKEQDTLRTVYIKTSSFPLIPQLTKGRKLDNLRLKMEEIEDNNNMNVRASYQTGNKVGSMNNAIDPFNDEELAKAEEASLVLDRNNFRIQQDVPFKSDMKKDDLVSMGTQIFKLLFGDGMLELDGFMLDGKNMTGQELYEHFTNNFGNLIALKKKGLYRELGLDFNGLPIDQKKSMDKLQKLLKKEATTRGYPRQDIEGLTMVEKKDINGETYYDFVLPLWISSNSNRYEALLNAIVTNRIISQKIPGNSFVVGSETGFEVKEDMSGIDQSRIIHVGNYTGGELRGVSTKDVNGKPVFSYAQALIPSKFKDAQGNLIDLYEKVNGKYKYLIAEKGQPLRLNMDMIDPELLKNFTFRTPTSSHVSASVVEVAGILPPESGDLMIVPKNFTKQKGLDYDVDKETAYQFWHIRTKSGRIRILNEQSKQNALKGLKRKLERNEKDDEFDTMMRAILKETYDDVLAEEETTIKQKMEKISDEFDQKIAENEFIKVHIAVYSNPNPKVQEKINKVLSMDFARDEADFIEGLSSVNVDNTNFTILSDEYQKEKMGLGAAGKLAIGVYSNYVTFHGLSQQVDSPLRLMDEGIDGQIPLYTRIGNFKSDGYLGLGQTLDGGRSIADAFAEKQNTATDNEKEQILGRVNINSHTINVEALLTLLGFDKSEETEIDGKSHSIPYLFISQPIIKEYVRLKQESQAITAEFTFDRDARIIKQLREQFKGDYVVSEETGTVSEQEMSRLSLEMTADNMIEMITGNKNIPGFQLAVLEKFLLLDSFARSLSNLQGVVNTTSLGKSIIESNEKYSKLESLSDYGQSRILNGHKLIGDFISAEEYNGQEGYLRVGNVYIKPTTPQGHIVVNGIKIGNDLWNDYFPYADENVKEAMKEVLTITDSAEKSDSRKIELMYDIFKEMKRYINSHFRNGIFDELASKERERLFIDTKEHESLATYMNKLKINDLDKFEDNKKEGTFAIKTNRLFSKFEYNLNTNGEPSTIRYNNTSAENFDEDYLYTAIAEMIVDDQPLPDFNGKSYSTKQLASDLVAYAYLEGGVQEAIQFVKYVPIEYLDTVGFTDILQDYSPKRDGSIFKSILGIKKLTKMNAHETHTFVKQYVQHNPQMARQYSTEQENIMFKKKKFDPHTKIMTEFILETMDVAPKFISRRNRTKSKRLQDKFSLYQHQGNNVYKKISILGVHGMNEYELGNENAVSLMDKAEPFVSKPNRVASSKSRQPGDKFNVKSGNLREVLTKISQASSNNYKHFGKLLEALAPLIKENTDIIIADTEADNGMKANGRTRIDVDGKATIILDVDVFNSNNHEDIARTIVHEFIHSITITELGKYFDIQTGKQKTSNVPLHVSRVIRIFNEVKKVLGPELEAFKEKRRKHIKGDLPSNTSYTSDEINVANAGSNIFEFVATALTEPDFQRKLSETPYKQSRQSIWEKFKEAIMAMLFSNRIPINKGSVTYEAMSSILEFIDIESPNTSTKSSIFGTAKQSNITLEEVEEAIEDARTDALNQALGLENENTEDDQTDAINKGLGLDLPVSMISKLPNICD